jgi:hypothetical protein
MFEMCKKMEFCSNNCRLFDVYVGYVSVTISTTMYGNIVGRVGHEKKGITRVRIYEATL